MEELIKNLTGIGIIANLGGMIFLVYQHFRSPDEDASKRLGVIEKTCPIKHKVLDDAIQAIQKSMELIKENHLRHIESDMSKINEKVARMDEKMDIFIELVKNKK